MKQAAFASESEIRLAMYRPESSTFPPMDFRVMGPSLRPYITVQLDPKDIVSIRLGPRASYPLNKLFMESFLWEKKVQHIPVETSAIVRQ